MYWLPWISFASWDYAANRWFCWKRLNRYDMDGNHKRSLIVLGRLRRRMLGATVPPPREEK